MPEQKFEKEKIEKAKLKEKKESLQEAIEKSPELEQDLQKREKIRQALNQLKKTTPASKRDEADEIQGLASENEKVAALIALTFEKEDIVYATSVAMSLKNPAILDQFHDTLIDEYIDELIERGIIK